MAARTERRHFIAGALRSLVNGALEGYGAIENVKAEVVAQAASGGPSDTPPKPRWSLSPPAASSFLRVSNLAKLAANVDMSDHLREFEQAARYSLRIMPAARRRQASGESQFGGLPRASFEWPWHGDRPLSLLAQIDLAAIDPVTAPAGLPATGALLFFLDLGVKPSAHSALLPGAVRVVLTDSVSGRGRLRQRTPEPLPHRPVRLVPELSLPRAWSSAVQRLGLSSEETEGWQRLRDELAAAQGTLSPEVLGPYSRVDRFLGFPDDKTGDMPRICELASGGGVEEPSADWRLLLQLSLTPTAAVALPRRLYYWIRERDLAAAQLERACAVMR